MEHSLEQFAELIEKVRQGDQEATTDLWESYFQRLVGVAARKLPPSMRRTGDEEDVALSAFHSFIAGVRGDRFPDLSGPENLWGLLITLTGRKAHAHLRHLSRQKRGGGNVRGESVFVDVSGSSRNAGLGEVPGDLAAADLQAELSEEFEGLLAQLPDDQLRQIAIMRMEGFLVDEVAQRLEISKRAVERRLQLIRKTWAEAVSETVP